MLQPININLEEKELEVLISSLLFYSSVNIVSDSNNNFQKNALDLALKLKEHQPEIKLEQIQFLKEQEYEDEWSESILTGFKDNIKTVTFDEV